MVLVQFQFVSGVDHLHHGFVFLAHLLREKNEQTFSDAPLQGSHYRVGRGGSLAVTVMTAFFLWYFSPSRLVTTFTTMLGCSQ